jgi:hypothetical protein
VDGQGIKIKRSVALCTLRAEQYSMFPSFILSIFPFASLLGDHNVT